MKTIRTAQVPSGAVDQSVQLMHAAGAALPAARIHWIACATLRLAQCPLDAYGLQPHGNHSISGFSHMLAFSAAWLCEQEVAVFMC